MNKIIYYRGKNWKLTENKYSVVYNDGKIVEFAIYKHRKQLKIFCMNGCHMGDYSQEIIKKVNEYLMKGFDFYMESVKTFKNNPQNILHYTKPIKG